MKAKRLSRLKDTPFLRFGAAVLAAVIFLVDTITDLEIAVAVFYIAIVLMSVRFCQRRGVLLVALGCMTLTVTSYAMTPTGAPESGLINCAISLSAIAASTYLVLRIEAAEAAVQDARSQLAHFTRLTSLDELTTSIAHEVNQPLAAVVTSGNAGLRWLSGQSPNLEKAKQAIERIIKDADRASEVIKRARALAKRSPHQKEWVNLNAVILETLALTRNELDSNRISLQTQLADDVPPILADGIQAQQVILNLVLNGIEALAELRDGPRDILVRSKKDGAESVLVAVCDTGRGFDPGSLDRLFDAFYTTKPDGLGIGLTISRTIIEAHGGRIWASSNAPRGAILQFTLPVKGDTA